MPETFGGEDLTTPATPNVAITQPPMSVAGAGIIEPKTTVEKVKEEASTFAGEATDAARRAATEGKDQAAEALTASITAARSSGLTTRRLGTIWATSTLILFSLISGKQAHYLLPAYPAMALLFAHASVRAKSGSMAWAALVLIAAGAGAIGLGLIPAKADLAQLAPYWPLTAFAALCLILSLLIWRLPRIPGHLLAGVALTLGLHGIIATTGLYAAYDGQALANILATYEANGLAVTNAEYNAEINFLARLTTPIALTPDLPSLKTWAQTHPNGMIFGRVKENPLTAAPQQVFHFFAQDWGLWPATSLVSNPSD